MKKKVTIAVTILVLVAAAITMLTGIQPAVDEKVLDVFDGEVCEEPIIPLDEPWLEETCVDTELEAATDEAPKL